DGEEPRIAAVDRLRRRRELDLPHVGQRLPSVQEIDQAAAQSARRRDFKLPCPDRLPERPGEQLLRALKRAARVLHIEAYGAHGCAMGDVARVSKALPRGVDDEIDITLQPADDRFRLMNASLNNS